MNRRSVLVAATTVAAVLATSLFRRHASVANDGLIERVDSKYNTILIYKNDQYMKMTFGYNRRLYTESVININDNLELPVVYTRYMTTPLIYSKNISSILEIGFGGGSTSWYINNYLSDTSLISIELDDKVIELAKRYFYKDKQIPFPVINKDGRVFLMQTDKEFDIILVDAYRGPFVPFHLMTKEFYELAKMRLREGGILAQNVEPTTMLFDAAVATLQNVFDSVEFFVADGNVVTIAYDGPLRSEASLRERADELQNRYGFRYSMPDMLNARRFLEESGNQEPLTDDFAPVESLRAIETHNKKWIEP